MAYVLEKMEKDDSSSDDDSEDGDSGDGGDEVKNDGGDEQNDIDSIDSKIRDRSLDDTIGFEPGNRIINIFKKCFNITSL